MQTPIRGALVEYTSDFSGPLSNVVLFQFNPENLSRTVEIPDRSANSSGQETGQAGEKPVERIDLTAVFNAADYLNVSHFLARSYGVGHCLAALEKLVHPRGPIANAIAGAAVDRVGDAVSRDDDAHPTQPIPRETYPSVLFLWGPAKVLPVTIESMRITEQQFDVRLNPIHAEVALGLSVMGEDPYSDDLVAQGALQYTGGEKEIRAMANAGRPAEQVIDIVKFI